MLGKDGLIAFLVGCLLAALILGGVQVVDLAQRLQRDEQTGCQIQARGLPTARENAAILDDLHAILTLPPSKVSQARQKAELPAAELKHETALLKDLNTHLADFQADEAKQPQTRSCQF